MSWASVTLGEVSTNIQTGPFGSQLHQSDYSDGGVPVVMPKDLVDGHISEDSIARVSMSHVDRLSRHKIEVGDILYSRRGDVGRCAFATEVEQGWLCGTGCLRVTIDQSKAIPKFIFYQLQKAETIGWVEKHAVGSTMLNLNTSIFGSVPIELPSMAEQQMIVHVLSAYDDLIENNQKQIKLLEEAAQRLYKEWFVDLRFPGHETTPIVDGIPEGWSKEELGNIAVLRAGGDRPKVFSKVKTVECSVPVFSNGTEDEGLYGFTNLAEIYDPCVTISARGSVGYTCLKKVAFVPIVRLISVIPKQIEVEYLFYFLKNMVFESNGAAQQQITVPMIKSKQVVLPAKTVINLFVSTIRPMMDLREKLKNKISALNEARNRLLPKLMSGEIEV